MKYLQECVEYAVKAVLIAYGLDYPKAHAVGRFLYEVKNKYPKWFLEQLDVIAEITDDLARGRPRFRYPFEYPPQEYENVAKEAFPQGEEIVRVLPEARCRVLRVAFSLVK